MIGLDFDGVPDLPQCQRLPSVARAIWRQESVLALWIGGSIARGDADAYSDIDLRVAVAPAFLENWRKPDFETLFHGAVAGHQFLPFSAESFLHHLVLTDGSIWDMQVLTSAFGPSDDSVVILGCRDEALTRKLQDLAPREESAFSPAQPEVIRQILIDYWILTHKHRKVLHRDLPLLSHVGIECERNTLLRLWFIRATGQDYNSQGQRSIFGLTQITRRVEQNRGEEALEILGAPLRNRHEIAQAIERMRDETAKVGRELARNFGFEYPASLEQITREQWAEFRKLQQG